MAGLLSCGSRVAKLILICFNILFWLIGLVVLAVGIWTLVKGESAKLMDVASVEGLDRLIQAAALTFIIIGFIVFITAFLGCCGVIKENDSMLLAYVVVIGCILVLQFVAGIMVALFKDEILSKLSESMNRTVTVRYDGESPLSKAYDFMQYRLECCGALTGPDDWNNSQWQLAIMESNATNEQFHADQVVPLTCCPLTSYMNGEAVAAAPDKCMAAAMVPSLRTDDVINTQGCYDKLEEWIEDIVATLLAIAFGFVALEAFGALWACYLRSRIKKGYETV